MTGFLKSFLAAPPANKTIRPQPTLPDPIHETVFFETGPALSSDAPTLEEPFSDWDAVRAEAVVAECVDLINLGLVTLTPPQRIVAEVYRALVGRYAEKHDMVLWTMPDFLRSEMARWQRARAEIIGASDTQLSCPPLP